MPHRPPQSTTDLRWLAVCLGVALLLRCAFCLARPADLSADPDGYLGIALNLREGRGFATPGTSVLTAYRPPLYPLLLAPVCGPSQKAGRAALHLLLAGAGVLLVWRSAGQLGFGTRGKCLAAGLFAVDPLLIRYSAFPMTETLAATLAAGLICLLTSLHWTRRRVVRLGVTLGLAILCRPTFAVFEALLLAAWVLASATTRRTEQSVSERPLKSHRLSLASVLAVMAIAVLTVSPWVMRNWRVVGTPVWFTTHGGYTLLLGNNPAFYEEVVQQPWGTVWDGSRGGGQAAWVRSLNQRMELQGLTTELQQDHFMQQEAWQTISSQPLTFARACVLKFTWFWNIGPHQASAPELPAGMLWLVRIYYTLFWTLLLAGVAKVLFAIWRGTADPALWLPPLLLIAAFTLMHLVYWSDARMRAPLVPAIALLCVAGITGVPGSMLKNQSK